MLACRLFAVACFNLYVAHLASLSNMICRGGRSSRHSRATVGAVFIDPLIDRHACLCRLESLALAELCLPYVCHTIDPYVIIGLTTVTYSQYICLGPVPQFLPQMRLHVHSDSFALFITYSRWAFQFSVLSMMTNGIVSSSREGGLSPSIFLFLVNGITTVLWGLIDISSLTHHL